jgi:predicted HAD superfamily Cof-like phosphohydrolase
MKKMLVMMAGIMFTVASFAQSKPSDWAQLKDFHTVMSQTFHPAEEGKLEPIKSRSGEMLEKAVAWQKSTPPEEFNKPEIKKELKSLVKGSKELDKMVKKSATDTELTKKLTDLHDVFHNIVGLCKDEHKDH